MSEDARPLGDLLSNLMEHPEMLQKAMGIASSLASSGILNGLMNTPADSGQSAASNEARGNAPSGSPDLSSIGNLLAGLMGSDSKPSDRAEPHRLPNESDRQNERPNDRAEHCPERRRSSHIGHNERIRLLQSLRPFLPCDKQEKIDFVIKLLGLLEAAEQMGLGKLF